MDISETYWGRLPLDISGDPEIGPSIHEQCSRCNRFFGPPTPQEVSDFWKQPTGVQPIGKLPEGFEFLEGTTDLGFEDLGLPPDQVREIQAAFLRGGVRVPGTPYRLRLERVFWSFVELADGEETAILPDHWREAVVVRDQEGKPTYVGKLVTA
jgi:hypothetical protein